MKSDISSFRSRSLNRQSVFIKTALFFILISVTGITLTENLNAADYLPVLVFGSKSSTGNGQFDRPYGIAVDNSDNIFVADTSNSRIQKFNSAGVYQSQFGSYGTGNGQFNSPISVAIDNSGNIFVLDQYNNRIQKFNSAGNYLSQFGSTGTGNGQFSFPADVLVDSSGNIFVADTQNHRIQKFNSDGVYQSQFGSQGSGNGQFSFPTGVAVDISGNIFVADISNNRIQKFNSDGVYQSQFGSQGSGNGQFISPQRVAIDISGNIFVADISNNRIQKFDSAGIYLSQFGSYGTGNGQFVWPGDITFDSYGNIFVADILNSRVQKFDSAGVYNSQFGSYVAGNGQFNNPTRVAVDSSGNIFVVDSMNHRIQKFNSSGVYQNHFGGYGIGNGQFDVPNYIAIDSSGNIFVADVNNHRIQRFDSSGEYQSQFGTYGTGDGQFKWPYGVAVDSSGNIFVVDNGNNRIQKFNSAGVYQSRFGSYGASNGQFDLPCGIAVDSSGNIFVADSNNRRIQKFDNAGVYQSQFGSLGSSNGQLYNPFDIAIDSSDNIFVADSWNNRIQKFNNAGVYQSQFGTYGTGNGQFDHPLGITIDISGNIFVADTWNNRIQKWAIPKSVISGYIKDSSDNPGIGVTLTFSNGGGTATTDSSGFYTKSVNSGWSGTVTPSKGSYKFTPQSFSYTNLISDMPDQNYNFVAKNKAIIVAGGGDYSTNALWQATKLNTDYAYAALRFQGYVADNNNSNNNMIRYLSAEKSLTSPADTPATIANLREAILSWASDAGDLLIYMADHGGNGTFRMSESEILTATELDGWLDTIQQTIPGNVILIYDACESGSFIGFLIPPGGKKRIIAASASAGEYAIFASDGTLSFSWLFWSQMYSGLPFYQTFLNTQNSMSLISSQHSVIEADGDGVPGGKGDSAIAAVIVIGDQKKPAGDFPTIGGVSPPQTLTDKTSATIYAENVLDTDGIKKVWAVINPPDDAHSSDTPVTSVPTAVLYPVGNNRYETIYEGFTVRGTYRIAVFATDSKDFTSVPEEKHITTVTQTQSFAKKGDISGDNQVNLTDVISALQVLSGLNPSVIRSDYASSGADVNGDGRAGLQEVVYILQTVAGLR